MEAPEEVRSNAPSLLIRMIHPICLPLGLFVKVHGQVPRVLGVGDADGDQADTAHCGERDRPSIKKSKACCS